jgi:hypothetical protein
VRGFAAPPAEPQRAPQPAACDEAADTWPLLLPLLLLLLVALLLLLLWVLPAAAAAAAAAAKSPDTLGGSGASGSANGVQSGGPASKGDDLARCRLIDDPLRAPQPLLGELLLLDDALPDDALPELLPAPPLPAAAAEAGARGMPQGVRAAAVCWPRLPPSCTAERPGTVGTTMPGVAAAAATSASVLLLVARLHVPALLLPTLSVK